MQATPTLIVIGASAGGVQPIRALARRFPASLPAAVFIVLHIDAHPSRADWLFGVAGPLPARFPEDGEPIRAGHIYVAPPDHHLLVTPGVIRLSRGPKENHTRPAVDPLFRTAAEAYGPQVIGVVLSGTLSDGTAGLSAVKQRGGVAVVQDPAEALFPDMPMNAMEHVAVDHCLPVAEMAPLLVSLCTPVVPAKAEPE